LVGPKTAAALREFEVDTQQIANEIGAFDKRTEAAFGHPQAALSQCFTVRILSGTRTFAEQAGHFDVRHQSELCDGTERDRLFPLHPRRRYLRSRDVGVVDRIN
jgi:hypothetical protein